MNEALFRVLHGLAHQSGFFDWLIVLVADYLAYAAVIVAVFIVSSQQTWRMRMKMFLFSALTVLVSRWILAEPIRTALFRPRPPLALGITPLLIENSPAFPSGHAAVFFALAFAILLFNKKWGYWFLGFAFCNGVARVIAGVHWPVDVLAGIVVSAIAFFVVKALFDHAEKNIPERVLHEEHLLQQ